MVIQIFEFGMILLFLLALIDAFRKNIPQVKVLLGCALAGMALEALAVAFLDLYQYGSGYLLVLLDVPVCIGIGWGIVVYLSINAVKALGVPNRLVPLAAGLMGLNIDLAMDVVAIREGMWHWEMGGFFGVPYINFAVWFVFVFGSAVTIEWALKTNPAKGFLKSPLTTAVNLLAGTFVNLFLYTWKLLSWFFTGLKTDRWMMEKGIPSREFDAIPFTILTLIHIYFLTLLVINGSYGIVWLSVISVAMLVVGVFVHFYPVLSRSVSIPSFLQYSSASSLVMQFFKN